MSAQAVERAVVGSIPLPEAETEDLEFCPDCDSGRIEMWVEGRERVHGLSEGVFLYSRCKDCGLLFQSRRPTEAAIGSYYPRDYGPYHHDRQQSATMHRSPRASGGQRWLRKLNRKLEHQFTAAADRRLESIYTAPRPGAVLLDYGCGSPEFLDEARSLGWATIGVDFAPEVLEVVAASGHRTLPSAPSPWQELGVESLDLVRLHHVLEHLYEPRMLLRETFKALRPGGVVHLGLPNPTGLAARLFGGAWWGLECPRHITLFSPTVVRAWLRSEGFESIEIVGEGQSKDFARSVGFWLGDRGWRRTNRLVSWLRDLLYLPCRGAARIGLGERFHAIARKPVDERASTPGSAGP